VEVARYRLTLRVTAAGTFFDADHDLDQSAPMYLIDCYQCRTKVTDEARICPKCGRHLGYARSFIQDTSRNEAPKVVLGKSRWI
jgi:hypothetical protein